MKKLNINQESKINFLKNIALIGHMGSGKSLLGKLIAKNSNLKHLDTDIIIEKKTKNKINQIFINHGEFFFRKIEEEIILNIPIEDKLILSLGGGSILSKKVRSFLKKNFITVFIDVKFSVLLERLENTKRRPLLKGVNIEKKLRELDINRRKFYLLADIILKDYDNLNKTLEAFSKMYTKLTK